MLLYSGTFAYSFGSKKDPGTKDVDSLSESISLMEIGIFRYDLLGIRCFQHQKQAYVSLDKSLIALCLSLLIHKEEDNALVGFCKGQMQS